MSSFSGMGHSLPHPPFYTIIQTVNDSVSLATCTFAVNLPLTAHCFAPILCDMKLLGTREAAEKLGVSQRRVRALIDAGTLVAHQLGREYAIEENALTKVKVYGKAGRPPKAKFEATSNNAEAASLPGAQPTSRTAKAGAKKGG